MDDFINEVDDTIKEEKLLTFWNKYGNFIIAGILAVILGTAGFVGWKSYKHSSKESESTAFFESMKMLSNKDYAGSIAKLKSLSKGASHMRELAKFREIAVLIEQKNIDNKPEADLIIPPEAIDLYKQIMDDKKNDVKFRNLATIAYVMLQMDFADPKELIKILESQLASVNPWANFAKELMAFLAVKAGDKTKAKALYEELSTAQGVSLLRLAALKAAIN